MIFPKDVLSGETNKNLEGDRLTVAKAACPPQTPPLLPKTFVPVDNGAGQDGDRALNICPPVVWGERALEAGQERRLRKACPSRLSGEQGQFLHTSAVLRRCMRISR